MELRTLSFFQNCCTICFSDFSVRSVALSSGHRSHQIHPAVFVRFGSKGFSFWHKILGIQWVDLPPKVRVTPNCMAFWDYKKCWFCCLRICLLRRNKGHWFQHSTRLHPAVPGSTWVPLLTRNIFRIKLTLCCKWFTSSKVSSWYRKHLPRLLVSWIPSIRGFRLNERHQNCKIALIRIQIIPKLPNIFKYTFQIFPMSLVCTCYEQQPTAIKTFGDQFCQVSI